mgnify:CR=1 FL=1
MPQLLPAFQSVAEACTVTTVRSIVSPQAANNPRLGRQCRASSLQTTRPRYWSAALHEPNAQRVTTPSFPVGRVREACFNGVTRRQACRLRAHFRREGRVMRHKRVALAFKRTGKNKPGFPELFNRSIYRVGTSYWAIR